MNEEAATPEPNGVFLSYSHRDQATAVKLAQMLTACRVPVRIDRDAMRAGQPIRGFILESIRQTHATVWLVSEESLHSDWVGGEITATLNDASLWERRRLIACYLDEGFLDLGFRLRATQRIDERLAQIDALLPQYAAKFLDTNDLNGEKSRLHELRSSLGALLERLKSTLCIDMREACFSTGMERLVRELAPSFSGPRMLLAAANDIEQRRQEVYDLIGNGDGERAFKRLMDFVRDFSDDKQHRKEAVVLSMHFHRVESAQGETLEQKRKERDAVVHKALDLLETVGGPETLRVA